MELKKEKNAISKQNRLEYIDVARGIAIILMIFAHTCHEPITRRIIYSFHMPIFFVISGYFYKKRKFKEELEKDFFSLIIPYFITCIIVCFLDYFNNRNLLMTNIKTSLLGIGVTHGILNDLTTVGPIWFLACMFFSKILFCIINNIIKKDKILLIVCILFNIVGFTISKFIFLPFSLDVAFIIQVYLYVGKYIKEKGLFERKLSIKSVVILLSMWILGIILGEFNYVGRLYPYYPLCIVTTIASSYLFIRICKFFSSNTYFEIFSKIFQFYGIYSLYILCIHRIEKDFIDYNLLIHTSMNKLNIILIFSLKMLIVTTIAFLLTYIIKKVKKREKVCER